MGEKLQEIDVKQLLSFCDDLVGVLRDNRDITNSNHYVENSKTLQSACSSDFSATQIAISDYKKKIDECKLKIETARSEVVGDEDIDRLQKDLDEELKREELLREELRALVAEIDELDEQRVSIEKQRQRLKKLEEEEEKEQRKLSFYASVTKIIPDLESNSKICGHIVNRDKKVVKKFEFDPAKEDAFDICNKTWKMIDQ
ncbi:kinetochore protein SPC24 homolog [Silene latifolia]|uniref:kinetochore protein SPC24 homolog n=1 Tax=Silene latifolia TaxID=37657 RepID=UPI003D77107C